ncbi:hypothetical protein IGI04_015742 [Brassica rapa subsp. trilocularis]|uniref:Uncharacterized protein n=1 Tax=Brassica rapa subsp. trilocularis TaxID=1813537 RepID=A0ABQ7MRF9_BRACM|nr:hypothetical protein IGI04_015742 [Brassica rapa subsp. trilocularis]
MVVMLVLRILCHINRTTSTSGVLNLRSFLRIIVSSVCYATAGAKPAHCFLALVPNGLKETPYSLDWEESDDREDTKEPKLTFNTKTDTTACLGAWYTWDRILQTSLEGLLHKDYKKKKNSNGTWWRQSSRLDSYELLDIGQKHVNRTWCQPPISLDSWKPTSRYLSENTCILYLEQAPEMTIELDNRSILKRSNRSMTTS